MTWLPKLRIAVPPTSGRMPQFLDRIDPERRGPRRIMDGHLTRARRPIGGCAGHGHRHRAAGEGRLQLRGRDRPGTQQPRRIARQVEHRGFQADGRRAAVEDQVDPAVQVGQDVLGAGRREAIRPIGAGRGDRPAAPRDEPAGHRPGRASHADRRLAGGDDVGNPTRPAQDERQRTRPEPGRQSSASAGHSATHRRAWPMSATWTISGLTDGRPLAAKIRATAAASVATAPRP